MTCDCYTLFEWMGSCRYCAQQVRHAQQAALLEFGTVGRADQIRNSAHLLFYLTGCLAFVALSNLCLRLLRLEAMSALFAFGGSSSVKIITGSMPWSARQSCMAPSSLSTGLASVPIRDSEGFSKIHGLDTWGNTSSISIVSKLALVVWMPWGNSSRRANRRWNHL